MVVLWLLIAAIRGHAAHSHHEGAAFGVVAGLIPCPLTLFVMTFASARGVPEAGLAFAFYAFGARDSVYAASLVPAFLFLGGVGALVRTYREWKAERGWAAWQGAGWFLMLLMLLVLTMGLPAIGGFGS